jgi:hypothetical protein
MELINATRMVAGYTMALEPNGRELLVIAVKGTFRIPAEQGARLLLHEEQMPLVMSDVFFGKPGLSAPKYEVDFAPRKLRCDVLLNGQAYAPGGRPCERVTVGLSVGNWSKSFDVVGDRMWYMSGVPSVTRPKPFTTMAVTYDSAFGGVDLRHEDPRQHAAFIQNPSGRGFHKHLAAKWLEGSPLPNTEESGIFVSKPDGYYRPMAFGPLGRHWEPRYRYAGTYDQEWLDSTFPFLPRDFDDQYYQAAPLDQQLALPVGEQRVTIVNLSSNGRQDFILPHFEAPICVFPKRAHHECQKALADTVIIEPDLQRVTITWRIGYPLKRSMFEVLQVLVGTKGPVWWLQREQTSFRNPAPQSAPTAGGPRDVAN